jgi:exodeoxyribonuclease VII large subunit
MQRRVPELSARGVRALQLLVARRRDRFAGEAKLLQSMSYKSVLARGFAVVRDKAGKMVPAAVGVKPGAALRVEFGDGVVDVTASAKAGQGDLF